MSDTLKTSLPLIPPPPLPDAKLWAVAWTKSRCEKALCEYLDSLGVPRFLPLVSKRRVWGGQAKFSQLPLFSGYVFFDYAAVERTKVFESRKVAQILQPPDPAQLERDLRNLTLALQEDETLRETRFGQLGRPVYVKTGPFRGLYGKLVRYDADSKLVVQVDFIGKAAELRIDEAFLEPAL
ncbi:MAG: hypothetical protein KIS92_10935 [Planctomycetota bacterium]|nr:hypothetical protein [Planctomycetota bacterium]